MNELTHLERLLAALYLSEAWHIWFAERKDLPDSVRLYAKTRAVVLFDRVLNDNYGNVRREYDKEYSKAFKTYFRAEPINQGSWM